MRAVDAGTRVEATVVMPEFVDARVGPRGSLENLSQDEIGKLLDSSHGGLYALFNASTAQEQAIGFVAVLLGAGNAAGGYAVTDRMLAMFKTSDAKPAAKHAQVHHLKKS